MNGLKNFGNVCYLNCIIQALSSCEAFIEYLSAHDNTQISDSSNHSLISHFLQLYKSIREHTATTRSKSAKEVWQWLQTNSSLDCFQPGKENDAGEALTALLTIMQHEICQHADIEPTQTTIFQSLCCDTVYHNSKSTNQVTTAAIEDGYWPFREQHSSTLAAWKECNLPCKGIQTTNLQCLQCMYRFEQQYEPFTLLSLPVQPGAGGVHQLGIAQVKNGSSVEDCVREHSDWELIQDAICPGCSIRTSLAVAINSGSTVLPQQLQELSFSIFNKSQLPAIDYAALFQQAGSQWITTKTARLAKSTTVLKWPKTLCIHLQRNYWHPSTGQHAKICGYIAFHPEFQVSNRQLYILKAIVAHTGYSPDTGHYIAYCSRMNEAINEREWYKISDEHVEKVSFDDIDGRVEAMLLFYELNDDAC